MKNKIASEFEKKRWYRVVKSFYVFFFLLFLVIFNFGFQSKGDSVSSFVIGNLIIIFVMGTMEGLFWYIVRGKWGYPKDEKPEE